MAEPARHDLRLYRGDTFVLPVRLWEDAVGGTAVDLTGAVARAEIRDVPSGGLLATFVANVTLPNAIDLTLLASSWDTFPARSSAVWDLEVTYPGDDVRTYLAGTVSIAGDATQ